MLKNRGFVWQICDFCLTLQRQTKNNNNYGRLPGGKLQFVMAGDSRQDR